MSEPRMVNCIQVGHNYGPHPETDHCMVAVPVVEDSPRYKNFTVEVSIHATDYAAAQKFVTQMMDAALEFDSTDAFVGLHKTVESK